MRARRLLPLWCTAFVAVSVAACSSTSHSDAPHPGAGGSSSGGNGGDTAGGSGSGSSSAVTAGSGGAGGEGGVGGGRPAGLPDGGGGAGKPTSAGHDDGGATGGAAGVAGDLGTSGAAAGEAGAAAGATGAGAAGGTDGGQPIGPVVTPVSLPDGMPGIGFDDLRYSPDLKKLLVPAGRTGALDLVDPQTLAVTAITGFTASSAFTIGKHRSGSTSADYGAGKIFAIDNETKSVRVIDAATNAITASVTLAAAPDYVRWVEATHEVWVTMPQNPGVSVTTPQIEVLRVPDTGDPTHLLNITFPASGPEALYIDNARRRAYTNNGSGGNTYAVDLMTHAVAETWKNGCSGLTVDLELDEARGFLMVACANGRLAVLDVGQGGKQLGEISMVGMGVDICGYNAMLHHMYLAGQDSMDLSIVGISAAGVPSLLGKVQTAKGAQMVASDDLGNAWVGDPGGGRLLKVRDTYAATP